MFGYAQTEGEPLAGADPAADGCWVDALPLIDVARGWGLRVETYPGVPGGPQGVSQRGRRIALGVKNPRTWAHGLAHAADDRLGSLVQRGQHWRSETVARLGSAVLLPLLGEAEQADVGFTREYIHQYAREAGLGPATACCRVLDRTCRAVRLILGTAGLGRSPADETTGATTGAGVT